MAMSRGQLIKEIKRLGKLTAEGRTYRLHTRPYKYPKGGNGFVLWARDEANADVAAKFFFRPNAKPVDRERFATEIKVLKKLDHPRVIKCLAAGTLTIGKDTFPYYVMPRAEGSMATLVKERQDLRSDLGFTCRFFVGLGDALQYLHVKGLFHRDIKEDNVLLDDEKLPILADVGIAHVPAEFVPRVYKSGGGEQLRNVRYSSPEQNVEAEVDHRTDIASFGYLLNHWLTGEPARPNPRLPSDVLNRQDAIAIDAVIETCIAREPQARYEHMRDCIADLRIALGETGEAKEQLGAFGSARRKLRALSRGSPQLELTSAATLCQLYLMKEKYRPDIKEENLLLYSCIAGRGPGWWWIRNLESCRLIALVREGLSRPFSQEVYAGCLRILGRLGGAGDIVVAKRYLKYPTPIDGAAHQAVGEIMDAAPLGDLQKLLRDGDPFIAQSAQERLAKSAHPGPLDVWKQVLHNSSPQSWDNVAVDALTRIGTGEALEELRSWARSACDAFGEHSVPGDFPDGAVRTLGEVGKPEEDLPVLNQLQERVPENSSSQHVHMIHAMVKLLQKTSPPGDLDFLLRDAAGDMRHYALIAVLNLDPPERPEALRVFLKDPDDSIRAEAISALGSEIFDILGIKGLKALCKEPYSSVRKEIAKALGLRPTRQGTELLLELLDDDEDDSIRAEAIRALGPEIVDILGIKRLKALCKEPYSSVRKEIAKGLGLRPTRQGTELLLELLDDEDVVVQGEASDSLARSFAEYQLSWQTIGRLIQDPRWFVRADAIRAVGDRGEPRGLELLRPLLGLEAHFEVAATVLESLGKLGTIGDLKRIAPYLKGINKGTLRRAAQQAANAILSRADNTGLIALLSSEEPRLRIKVIEVAAKRPGLLNLGLLGSVLNDSNTSVRFAAAQALGAVLVETELAEVSRLARLDSADGWHALIALSLADERLYCPVQGFRSGRVLIEQLGLISKPADDDASGDPEI